MDPKRVYIRTVSRNSQNRHLFRQVARSSSSEVYDIPEENKAVFAYLDQVHRDNVAAVASWKPAKSEAIHETTDFECDYYNVITYLFVRAHWKEMGLGTMLVKYILDRIKEVNLGRPTRLQSARRARGFFEKAGFQSVGEPIETLCGPRGAPLFSVLIPMEKN